MSSWSVSNIIQALYSTINSPDKLVEALDKIAAQTNARGVVQVCFNETGFEYRSQCANSLYFGLDDLVANFTQRFYRTEKQANDMLLQTPFGEPLYDHQIWPEVRDFGTREDYKFTIEHLGVFRKSGFNLSPEIGWKAGIILQHGVEYQSVPKTDIDRMKPLLTHLAKVSELTRFVSQLQTRYRAVLSVLDHIKIGVCLVDERSNVLVANKACEAVLDQQDGLRLLGGKLRLFDAELQPEFDSALEKVASTAIGQELVSEYLLKLDRPSRKSPFVIAASPLKDGGGELATDLSGAIVMIFDTDAPPDIDIAPLTKVARLTKTEQVILSLLISGHTDKQIAESRSVKLETTRGQIKQILGKCRVGGRVDLVRRAAQISPPIG